MAGNKKTENATPPVEPSWNLVFKQLQEDKVEYFLSTQLEPTVLIPTDSFQTEWPVDSQRFQDLLISLFYEISNGKILRVNDREFLMAQIREECRKGGRRLTDTEAEVTDEDAIVQTIVVLMNQQVTFSDQTAVLATKLRKIQAQDLLSSSHGIPTFTNIFSRKLGRLIPVLRGYHIEVVMEHRETGSHCTLTRLPGFQNEPTEDVIPDGSASQSSGQSSGATPNAGKGLPPADGADGTFRVDAPKSSSDFNDTKTVAASRKGGAK